ncbi:MAG: DUF1465 family protein [Hyphomicrobiaceae bacterium]
MSSNTFPSGREAPRAVTVSFGERFAASSQFDAVFREGMALVERTASYLEGAGRRDAKSLKPPVSVIYATESMRLTTRLLEVASWLLVHRALKEAEISAEEAAVRRARVKLRTLGRPQHVKHFDDLPVGLRDLIAASFAMTDRLVQLDRALNEGTVAEHAPAANPVGDQFARLAAAFPALDSRRAG